MFKLVGIIVVMMFFFKIGKRVRKNRDDDYVVSERTPKKMKKEIQKTITDEVGNVKRYFYEIITNENGETKKQIRTVEEIDKEEYLELRDEVR